MAVKHSAYAGMFGPTKGDKIRLADTNLVIEIEQDLHYNAGDELKYGAGKSLRDGMGQSQMTNAEGALDLVINHTVVLDPTYGVIKADLGIKDGRIVGLGKAGNPDTMDGVTLPVGPGTEAVDGSQFLITPGLIDSHVHYLLPEMIWHGLANGVTTLFGGGVGHTTGSRGTTCTPGPWHMARMLEATDDLPVNFGFFAKANASRAAPLIEQLEAGACGLKLHEDWGSTPQAIDTCLGVADDYDVQAMLHADTLNESGYLEDTIAAIAGRTIHTFHTEGAGGGHAPDMLGVAGLDNVLPSSTNPTRPFTVNTTAESLGMIVMAHHLKHSNPEDIAMAQSRIRAETMAAEDALHDMGALSIYSSDALAMGRIGETFTRLIQTAHKMKEVNGALPEDAPGNDNFRLMRYLAKMTINPAIAQGVEHTVGSLQPGRMADLVMWPIRWFGAKPTAVMKGGLLNVAMHGDPGASIPPPEPAMMRRMFGAQPRAAASTSAVFVSKVARDRGVTDELGLHKRAIAVENTRHLKKKDMRLNGATPKIDVDPDTFEVRADGQIATAPASETLPLTQRHFLI